MNITYIIGTVVAFVVMIVGMLQGGSGLGNHFDTLNLGVVD